MIKYYTNDEILEMEEYTPEAFFCIRNQLCISTVQLKNTGCFNLNQTGTFVPIFVPILTIIKLLKKKKSVDLPCFVKCNNTTIVEDTRVQTL